MMKSNKFIALTASVVLTALIMTTLATPAARAETDDLDLTWSDSSATLSSSTEALAANQPDNIAAGRAVNVHMG